MATIMILKVINYMIDGYNIVGSIKPNTQTGQQ